MKVHRNVTVLKTKDAGTLREIEAVLNLRGAIIRRLTDTAIVVDSSDADRIIKEIRSQGYRPKLVMG